MPTARDVQVSVPEGSEPQLYAFVASLWSASAPAEPVGRPEPVTPNGPTPASVRSAYLGGTSIRWRPFLEFFARRPDQWTRMDEGFQAVGFSQIQGVGMVGAAERRCGSNLPYEKRWNEGKREVRMSTAVARQILDLARDAA